MATVIAGSALRALAWRRPAKKAFIEPVEAGLARLEDAATRGKGAVFDALCQAAPVHGGDAERPRSRTRRMRSDGRRNLVSLTQALIASADLATGFLGSPRGERWDRHDWGRLDHRAYGARVERERSFRRTQRHARTLEALGFVEVRELKVSAGPGQWKSVVAIKRLTDGFYVALGLMSAVKRARRERDRKKGQARTEQLAKLPSPRVGKKVPGEPAPGVRAAAAAYQAFPAVVPPAKPPDRPPGVSATVADAMAKARAALGIG